MLYEKTFINMHIHHLNTELPTLLSKTSPKTLHQQTTDVTHHALRPTFSAKGVFALLATAMRMPGYRPENQGTDLGKGRDRFAVSS